MKDWGSIHELEEQIVRDEQRYREIEGLEEKLMQNIAQKGFKAASTRGRYRDEKQTLEAAIRQNKERLAGARAQPN